MSDEIDEREARDDDRGPDARQPTAHEIDEREARDVDRGPDARQPTAHEIDEREARDVDRGPDARQPTAHEIDEREARDVDSATAERLSQGVIRDTHGEYAPDPFPDGDATADSQEEVIEQHRRQAERVEQQPDVPRADGAGEST